MRFATRDEATTYAVRARRLLDEGKATAMTPIGPYRWKPLVRFSSPDPYDHLVIDENEDGSVELSIERVHKLALRKGPGFTVVPLQEVVENGVMPLNAFLHALDE